MNVMRSPEEFSETEKKFSKADFSLINSGEVHRGLPWGAIFDRLGWPEYFGLRIEKNSDGSITIFEKDEETGAEKKQEIPEVYRDFIEEYFDLDREFGPCCGYKDPSLAGTALFPDLTVCYMLGYEQNCMYVFWLKRNGGTNLCFVFHSDEKICCNTLNNDALEFARKNKVRIVNETSYTVCWGSVHEDETPEKWTDIENIVKSGHN